MQAWLVRIESPSPAGSARVGGTQTIVHADDEADARKRGAEALGTSIYAVTVVRYGGPTLGTLAT